MRAPSVSPPSRASGITAPRRARSALREARRRQRREVQNTSRDVALLSQHLCALYKELVWTEPRPFDERSARRGKRVVLIACSKSKLDRTVTYRRSRSRLPSERRVYRYE